MRKKKRSRSIYLWIAGIVLALAPIFLAILLIVMIAGGGAATNEENTTTNRVPGVYPPNGMQIPIYYQTDYPTVLFGGGSIATSGCGPTSFAMVVTYLKNQRITPPDVVLWAGATTYYVPGAGMSWSFFADAVAHYECGGIVQTSDAGTVLRALADNRPVICSQRAGIFTSAGHFIVLRGVTSDGKVLVNDPNDNPAKNFINREFDMLTEIHATANSYWIFDQRQIPEGGGSGDYNTDNTTYTQEQLQLIWACVYQEDRSGYEGALAVISCIMNRVDSPRWSNLGRNAYEQLTSPGQFCYSFDDHWRPFLNGNVPDHVKLAVDDCLRKGIRNHNYTSFRSTQGSQTGSNGETIGGGNYYFN